MPTSRRVASHDHVATWAAAVRERSGAVPAAVVDRLLEGAPLAYVENCSPDTAAQDLVALHGLAPGEIAVAVRPDDVPCRIRIRIRDAEAPLDRVLPVLASMGVDAIDERAHQLTTATGTARVYDLSVALPTVSDLWPGQYDQNRLDGNMILDRWSELDNYYVATGFSGHGLMHSPAVGRALSELILYGGFQTIDLDRMGLARVLADEPYREVVIR